MEIEQDHEMVVYSRGRFFPNREDMRANLLRGNTADCPIVGANFTMPIDETQAKKVVELGKRVVDYCWVHCNIRDCPTYIAEHRLKI